jgi:hypothetical protein
MTDYATARQLVATLGDKQRLKYKVTPTSGSLLPADSLGGQMTALADLFNELGKKDGLPLKTLVSSVSTHEDGAVEFELVIVPLAKPEADKDLLEALEELLKRRGDFDDDEYHALEDGGLECERARNAVAVARAAIAKARGTT